jgi:microcystin-dependent protein
MIYGKYNIIFRMSSVLRKFMAPSATEKHTVGDTKLSMVNVDHMGWMLCNGRSLLIADYKILFNVIGNVYGGDGVYFFNLPNPAGRVLGVVGSGPGLTARNKGASTGEETHVLTVSEMPIHGHTGTTDTRTTGITHNANGPPGYGLIKQDGINTMNSTVNDGAEPDLYAPVTALSLSDPGHTHTFTTATNGSSVAHNNMQPTLFVGNMFLYSGLPKSGTYPYFGSNIA